MGSKEILTKDSENFQSSGSANNNGDDGEVETTKIETIEELGDLPGTSESSSDSDAMNNVHDDDAELADNEKTKPEVSKINVTVTS
jgi:hypothetical protein